MDEIDLTNLIYPYIEKNYLYSDFMCDRAILAAKNSDVDRINELASQFFPGESQIYLSADSLIGYNSIGSRTSCCYKTNTISH